MTKGVVRLKAKRTFSPTDPGLFAQVPSLPPLLRVTRSRVPEHVENARNHILLAEDDSSTAELLQSFLQDHGYQVFAVDTGADAIEHLRHDEVDLVLSDLSMPEGDGFDLVSQVRDMGLVDLPFILMSANYESVLRVKGLKLGADDFVLKPLDLDELLARIETQLRRSDRQSELARATVIDPLTRTLNRRGLMEQFSIEKRKRTNLSQHVAALLIDLDEFKRINDTYGHSAGDAAIQAMGQTLERTVRASDRVCRIGGDEFVVLMPDSDEESAKYLAQRVLALSPLKFTLRSGATLQVAFSLGVSVSTWETDLPSLLAHADARMYEHKRRTAAGSRN